MANCRAVTLIRNRPPGSFNVATKPITNEPVTFTIKVSVGKASPNRCATTPDIQCRAIPPKALPNAIQRYSIFKQHSSNKFMTGAKGKTGRLQRKPKDTARNGLDTPAVFHGYWHDTARLGLVRPVNQSQSITNNRRESRRIMLKRKFGFLLVLMALSCGATMAVAGEGDITIPDLTMVKFAGLGGMSGAVLMYLGLVICGIGAVFGLVQYRQTKALPAHESMANVSNTIWETCKTYLWTQGKFLALLWLLIAACMIYYFKVLQGNTIGHVIIILLCSILGILGSYGVAWFGIRINTVANSRTAFSALQGNPLATLGIPLRSGMSVGLLLVAVELFFMICILMFLKELAGPCFIGFAIGESLGASVLRICGGIFTKIADIGSDLMKIVFKLPEDDPKNPGVIADCTVDNAGDSVGPTADGFETYGVTGVALISFITLAVPSVEIQAKLIVWIFAMRFLMDFMSGVSYFINQAISEKKYQGLKEFNFEEPLTRLIWIASIL